MLDLDDVRAQVPEDGGAQRSGEDAGKIQNLDARERAGIPRISQLHSPRILVNGAYHTLACLPTARQSATAVSARRLRPTTAAWSGTR